MREYFEKESMVEAFQSESTYLLGEARVRNGDWVVIKDGVATIMTSQDFHAKYTDKTITHTTINYPTIKQEYYEVPRYNPPAWLEQLTKPKYNQPYYGDSPNWTSICGAAIC